MSAIALARLGEERKNWRKDHPTGFYARLVKKNDNSINLMKWEIGIPGKEGTDWAGGVYKVIMDFPNDYPTKPPACKFDPPIYHPNIFTSGAICLSLLKENDGWRPAITIKQLALGIQDLFDTPNPQSPANVDANKLYLAKRADYNRRIREQAKKHAEEVIE